MNLTKIFAALLVVLAIVLAIMAWVLGRQSQPTTVPAKTSVSSSTNASTGTASSNSQQSMADVIVAAHPLKAGHKLTAQDIKVVPQADVPKDALQSPQAAIGQTTLIALNTDTPLLEQYLINGLSLQLEPGQRAVSIAVKESMAAGNHVRPGDFVDVFFTLHNTNNASGLSTPEKVDVAPQTRLLLARSRVLAYGAASVEDPPQTLAQRKKAQEQEKDAAQNQRRAPANEQTNAANTAVLAIALEDVQRLTLAEKFGQLTLALRHPDDASVPDPSLFAALPTALQPLAGKLPKGQSLQGADLSYAGLRFQDLAQGGSSKVTRSTASTSQPSHTRRVQMHQGASVQTVNY